MKRTKLLRKTPLKQGNKPLRQRSGFKRPSKDAKGATDGPRTRPSVDGKGPPYRGSKIKARSKKREKDEKEYSRLRTIFLDKHPQCIPCMEKSVGMWKIISTPATQVHHKAGRGRFYLMTSTWLPVCQSCHEEITNSREWAETMGYSLTKAERRAL